MKTIVSAACVTFALVGAMPSLVHGQDAPRVDYLTFAHGAVPLRVGGGGLALGANFERALQMIDGNPLGVSLTSKPGPADTATEFVYVLPAPTTFDRFAVPNVLETPSPTQTFTKLVEVFGSAVSADEGFTLLATGTLQTHKTRGEVTELPVVAQSPVQWVKLRLSGGIQVLAPQMFFEFSEIIGNGIQETPKLVDHFNGTWQGRGVLVALEQDGAAVSGCYDKSGQLTGSVTGNILRATGIDLSDKTPTVFILSVAPDGVLRGVASTQRGPFRMYTAPRAPAGTKTTCADPPPPTIGCGSVVHGINFGYDSADIRPESEPILAKLFEGLRGDKSASIIIEGHTSGEGSTEYNQGLSERRARAVVGNLVGRGLDARRLTAAGAGESRPIATNDDESGRSMNRRVEVTCR